MSGPARGGDHGPPTRTEGPLGRGAGAAGPWHDRRDLAHRDRLPPRGTGCLAATIGLRRVWLLALGAYGTLQTVPQTAER
ncbi:hypothetical protein [Streptomyces sp. NPDC057403]|uniref:hypothetical protein n=1 Tax=Streptomyces sp. NPDC057403 TaxID=3346119 RepID=UPI0036C49E53